MGTPSLDGREVETLRSPELRQAIVEYARQLKRVLGGDLHFLSKSGLTLKREDRVPLRVQKCNPLLERGQHWTDQGSQNRDEMKSIQADSGPVIRDTRFLEAWLQGDCRALLIVAPFGSGKSVLLAEFACRLADQLDNEKEWREGMVIPYVPWPIRLREWPNSETALSFQEFVLEEAPKLLHLGSSLSLEARRLLLRTRRLLFLFDGFDELVARPTSGITNTKDCMASDLVAGIRSLGCERFVITSRPDHGAERHFQFEKDQIHTIRELEQTEIEAFVCKNGCRLSKARLGGSSGPVHGEAVVEAYRKATPHIQNMLIRPLFLMAWYARATENPEVFPETITELMTVVYEAMFRQRGMDLDHQQLLDARHVFGALLMPFAEKGFRMPVIEEALIKELRVNWLFQQEGEAKRWLGRAVTAGFITEVNGVYYAMKVPATEFLVGYYLAWLCRGERSDSRTSDAHRQFFGTFRKWFWWRNYDDIWLYAFDCLWRDTASSEEVALEAAEWLSNISERSLRTREWTELRPPPYVKQDRDRLGCDGLLLRVILPLRFDAGKNKSRIRELTNLVFDRFVNSAIARERSRVGNGLISMLCILPERSNEICYRLLHWLSNEDYRDLERGIVEVICAMSEYLTPAVQGTVSRLVLEWLKNPTRNAPLGSILNAVRKIVVLLAPSEQLIVSEMLIQCLSHKGWRNASGTVAFVLGEFAGRLAPVEQTAVLKKMIACLGKPEYVIAGGSIACGLAEGIREMEPTGRATVLKALVECLGKPEYAIAQGSVAYALGSAVEHLEPTERTTIFELLKGCLRKPEYENAWGSIASALGAAVEHLEPAERTTIFELLDGYLRKPEYENAWGSIASALGAAVEHLKPAERTTIFAVLIECLGNPEYEEGWDSIASALAAAAGRLEPAEVTTIFEPLNRCLRKPEYENAWNSIAWALGRTVENCESAERTTIFAALTECLTKPEYEKTWSSIAWALEPAFRRLSAAEADLWLDKLTLHEHVRSWLPYAGAIKALAARVSPIKVMNLISQIEAALSNWGLEASDNDSLFAHEILWASLERLDVDAVQGFADSWARGGRITDAVHTVNGRPELAWFIRRFAETDTGERVVYGVCRRTDPNLLLDAELQCAPPEIRRLLRSDTPPQELPSTREALEFSERSSITLTGQEASMPESGVSSDVLPPRYVFRRVTEDYWLIAYGAEGPKQAKHMMGFLLIAELLKRPGVSISDIELLNLIGEKVVSSYVQPDEIISDATAGEYKRCRIELRPQMADKDKSIREVAIKQDALLAKELDKWEFWKKRGSEPNKDKKNRQNNVWGNIKNARRKLAKDWPALFAHFVTEIKVGADRFSRRYGNTDSPTWDVGDDRVSLKKIRS
ncbi:MAG: NACHT domain-containing protein [Planctomycetes bacterium]|nr:NACHT domain-containing protein [Planctomycetota bacterium]